MREVLLKVAKTAIDKAIADANQANADAQKEQEAAINTAKGEIATERDSVLTDQKVLTEYRDDIKGKETSERNKIDREVNKNTKSISVQFEQADKEAEKSVWMRKVKQRRKKSRQRELVGFCEEGCEFGEGSSLQNYEFLERTL